MPKHSSGEEVDDFEVPTLNASSEVIEPLSGEVNDQEPSDSIPIVAFTDKNEDGASLSSGASPEEMNSIPAATPTPLPKKAIIMISLLIIAEAVGWSILYPIVPFMVRDFLLFEKQSMMNSTQVSVSQNSAFLLPPAPSHMFYTSNFVIASRKQVEGNFDYLMLSSNFTMDLSNQTSNSTHSADVEISEERVGLLVGVLASAISIAQLFSNWFMSRASDNLGRKPFLMSGLIVNCIFLGLFSISKSFWFALTVRVFHGLLNANIPIYKAYLVDITDDSNQEKAFVIVSILWAVSNVVSPGLGGFLSDPATKWPFLFGGESSSLYKFFHENPYVLPLSLPILMNLFTLMLNLFFMKESLKKRSKAIIWIEDKWNNLLVKLKIRKPSSENTSWEESSQNSAEAMDVEEENNIELQDMERTSSKAHLIEEETPTQKAIVEEKKNSTDKSSILLLLRDSLVLKVVFLYMMLGITTNMLDEMLPVFCSNSIKKRGLGLDSSAIGLILSIGGICSLIMLVVFPKLSSKFGFLWLYRIGCILYAVNVLIFPFSAELVRFESGTAVIWVFVTCCVFLKACAQEICYTCQFLLVNNAAPSAEQIGSINGLAHITASIGWSIGPFIAGVLVNLGMKWADAVVSSYGDTSEGFGWFISNIPLVDKLPFVCCAFVGLSTFGLSMTVPKSIVLKRRFDDEKQVE